MSDILTPLEGQLGLHLSVRVRQAMPESDGASTSSESDGASAALDELDVSDYDGDCLDNQGEQLAGLQRHDERVLTYRRDAPRLLGNIRRP
jgi:hypothetical protein